MEAATGESSFSILFTFNKLECEKRTVKYVSVRLCCFVELLCSFPIAAVINHQKLCSLKIILMFSLAVLEIRSLMWVSAGYHQDAHRAVPSRRLSRRTPLPAFPASRGHPHSWFYLCLSSKATVWDPADDTSIVLAPSDHKGFFPFRDNFHFIGPTLIIQDISSFQGQLISNLHCICDLISLCHVRDICPGCRD